MDVIRKYLHKRLLAFGYSFQGVGDLLWNHPHAHVHALATIVVTVLGVLFPLGRLEWALLVVCVGSVWAAEALNTAVEYLTDLVSPEFHPLAGKVKDMASGAVLLISIAAAIVGILVFWPHLLHYFES